MLRERVITAIFLLLGFIFSVFFTTPQQFIWVMAGIAIIAGWEWVRLIMDKPTWWHFLGFFSAMFLVISLVPTNPYWLTVFYILFWLHALRVILRFPETRALNYPVINFVVGVVLAAATFWSGLYLYNESPWLLLFAFVCIWSADIGAYFAGRQFGRRKIAPNVSPGKTWEGYFGGLLWVVLLLVIANTQIEPAYSYVGMIIAGVLLHAASVIGDLFESMFKRHRNMKDSSQLLPGHGGVLDRIDSVIAALPLFALAHGWLA